MDSNDRERVEEVRVELKKMVNLYMKKRRWKLFNYMYIMMLISNGYYNLTKGDFVILFGVMIWDGFL